MNTTQGEVQKQTNRSIAKILWCLFISIFLFWLFLYYLSLPSNEMKQDYSVDCIDADSVKMPLLKCGPAGKTTDRRRLSFGKVIEANADFAERVALIRDRIHDLESSNRASAAWAHNMHMRFSCALLIAMVVVLFFGTSTTAVESITSYVFGLAKNAPILFGLAALVYLGAQSLAYGAKYATFLETARRYAALSADIDTRIVFFVKSAKAGGVVEAEMWKEFEKHVGKWLDTTADIEREFGKALGKSYAFISSPLSPGK